MADVRRGVPEFLNFHLPEFHLSSVDSCSRNFEGEYVCTDLGGPRAGLLADVLEHGLHLLFHRGVVELRHNLVDHGLAELALQVVTGPERHRTAESVASSKELAGLLRGLKIS